MSHGSFLRLTARGFAAIGPMFAAITILLLAGCCSSARLNAVAAAEPPPPPVLTIVLGQGIPPAPIQAIAQLPDGTMAIGTRLGLALWRDGKAQVLYGPYIQPGNGYDIGQKPGNSLLPTADIAALLVDRRGTLWIGGDDGLCRMVNGKLSNVTSRLPRTWHPGENAAVPIDENTSEITGPSNSHDITALFERADGTIVIGSRNGGLFFHDPAADTYTLIKRAPDMNISVTSIAEDPSGILWVATAGEGLVRITDGKAQPVLLKEEWGDPARVRWVDVSREDDIWLCIGDQVIASDRSGATTRRYKAGVLLPDSVDHFEYIHTIQIDRAGRVWAFGLTGVAVFDGKQWRYPEWDSQQNTGYGCILFESKDGTRWLGNSRSLMRDPPITWHNDPPSLRFLARAKSRVEKEYPNITAEPGSQVAIDRLGRAWLSTSDSLLVYAKGKWKDMKPMIGESKAYVRFMQTDSKGRLWIGTSDAGVIVLDGDKQRRLNDERDLDNSSVYCMVEAINGDVWVSTGGGLYALTGDTWRQVDETRDVEPIAIDSLGRVWFGDYNFGLFILEGGEPRPLSAPNNALGGFVISTIERAEPGQVRVRGFRESPTGTETRTVICDGKTMTVVGE